MKTKVWRYCVAVLFLLLAMPLEAQQFFNLTAEEVKIDSVLPRFVYSKPLSDDYQDSIYTATVKYAEYVDMTVADIANYNRLSGVALPSQVAVNTNISVCRKKGTLVVSFCPLVFRNNKYQILASFMLDVKAKVVSRSLAKARLASRASSEEGNEYAAHSVLASGRWAKIRVPETGVYRLTESVIRQAGFTNINKVKIYGYGGNLQNESLYASEIYANDDLKEVPQCVVNGNHLFFGKGPVSWSSRTSSRRTRNPYSDYGYYFITQADEAPLTVDSTEFVSSFYPSNDFYHSIHEVDGYAWYHGGRNLYDKTPIALGDSMRVVFSNTTGDANGNLTVNVSAGVRNTGVEVYLNGRKLGTQYISFSTDYNSGGESSSTYSIQSNLKNDTIVIKTIAGGPVRLDYVSMAWKSPKPAPRLSGNLPVAQYVHNITNQDHHADALADMVIIIPTSQKLLRQAQRLKAFHESHDGLRVNLVPADELYNEFSSGTPDAGAYRRYLRMLSDKATTEADMPKYLLLFGDCVWDNRMLIPECQSLSPDDYLLCYESENSFSDLYCYVSDSWMGILSEGAGANPTIEQQDVAVGRFPVSTPDEAKVMVDKTINYMENKNAGSWQNTIMYMGDDGNDNLHMKDEDEVAEYIAGKYPDFQVKKVMWDAYQRETSSVGNSYPDATKIILQQQANGALIMDYAGHGSAGQLSHEKVIALKDFSTATNTNLPLWITAACDVMPFDGVEDNIGEAAVLNANGGAVAFYGTTRTVYANRNKYMNRAFLQRVLSLKDGKPMPIGEAHRLAQNDLVLGNVIGYDSKGQPIKETDLTTNRLQYALLGDPAMPLNIPTQKVVVDSINGIAVDGATELPVLKAGMIAKIDGHVVNGDAFNGVVTTTVLDSKELITCRMNESTDEAFQYYDRTKTLYNGSDSVRAGKFSFRLAVSKDINYADAPGLITLYAANHDQTVLAHGMCDAFNVGGSELAKNDSIGPSIYCYLNTPSFVNGGNVNPTPFFVAEVRDKDGINATGSGIGHDLQLIIDGDVNKTYNLNNNFTYDFGTYTSGSTYYSIPELEAGPHQLQFRAWDIQNNSSTATLTFNVVKNLKPSFDLGVTENPAKNSTTFIINHDRASANLNIIIEVFDTSGRKLWHHAESGVSASGAYTIKWDLSTGSGTLRTGIYLYRVQVSSDGSGYESKTKKLIVINN
nr:type IX secretion system sortase PorU [uncultured Prevotella sp.]